jgi:hypothetical protein
MVCGGDDVRKSGVTGVPGIIAGAPERLYMRGVNLNRLATSGKGRAFGSLGKKSLRGTLREE